MVPLNWRFILSCLFILITRGSNGNRSQSLHLSVFNDGTKKHKVCRSTPFDFYTVGERYLHYQIKWEKRQVHNCYLIKDMNLIAQVCVIEPTWQVQILMCKRTQSQVNQTQWEYTQGQSGCLMPKALAGSSLGLCFAVLWVKGDSIATTKEYKLFI